MISMVVCSAIILMHEMFFTWCISATLGASLPQGSRSNLVWYPSKG